MILWLFLMLSVAIYRAKAQVETGYGADQNLERVSRRHGNLGENTSIFLITLALLELRIGSTTVVFVLATIFVVARFGHAIGFPSLAGSHLSQGSKFSQLMRCSELDCPPYPASQLQVIFYSVSSAHNPYQ